jgi:hypothetical protein
MYRTAGVCVCNVEKHSVQKTWGSGAASPSALDGGGLPVSRLGCFTIGEIFRRCPLDGRLRRPRSWCELCKDRRWESNPGLQLNYV